MASLPIRFTVCTYNIWTNTRWPERRAALQGFAASHLPDLLCLQEVIPDSRAALDEVLLPTHQRVDDAFGGWSNEGNIYWNTALFELAAFGAEQIGILETLRRLFWVRLNLRDDSGRTLLVSTAHYTYSGHPEAIASEKNVRMPQARETVAALARVAQADEPTLFMGDLNDTNQPIHILRDGGLQDCFTALGRYAPHTWPAMPTSKGPQQTIDWMLHRGPIQPMTAEVVDYYLDDLAPSDHKPVLATYQFKP